MSDYEYACTVLAEHFGSPCDYQLDGVDIAEFITDADAAWCDAHCGLHGPDAKCWAQFFKLWRERKS